MKLVEEECDQTDIRLAKYVQNSERTSSWNNQSDIVQLDHILSGWAINYLAGPYIVRLEVSGNSNYKSDIVWFKSDNV
jgi:hypothetical protein